MRKEIGMAFNLNKLMGADLYLSYHLAEQNQTLVIEGDGFSVWAYLLQEDDENIDFGGFLCSTGTLVDTDEEVEHFLKEGNQPPLLKEFANEFSIVPDLKSEEITVESLTAETITVSIRGRQYLLLDVPEKQAYSIAVSQDGPYGYVLETGSSPDEEE